MLLDVARECLVHRVFILSRAHLGTETQTPPDHRRLDVGDSFSACRIALLCRGVEHAGISPANGGLKSLGNVLESGSLASVTRDVYASVI